MTGLRLITPPATLPITLAEAKTHLAVDHSDHDAMIMGFVRAALSHVERSASCAFEAQTWEIALDEFPCAEIMIPIGPLQSVVSVTYTDIDGAWQTVSSDDYEVDLSSRDGWVVPVTSWPSTMEAINAVRVQFIAGGGTPEDVKQAMLLLLGHWYASREAGGASESIPFGVEALMGLNRRMFV